jgi:hypothetical protein
MYELECVTCGKAHLAARYVRQLRDAASSRSWLSTSAAKPTGTCPPWRKLGGPGSTRGKAKFVAAWAEGEGDAMSRDTLRIYVPVGDAGMLPEAERRIRQEACEALQEAGVTAPDVETDAAPGGVIDQSEAVLGGVSITVRIPPAAIRDLVEVKIMEALMAAGFDPAIEPDEG